VVPPAERPHDTPPLGAAPLGAGTYPGAIPATATEAAGYGGGSGWIPPTAPWPQGPAQPAPQPRQKNAWRAVGVGGLALVLGTAAGLGIGYAAWQHNNNSLAASGSAGNNGNSGGNLFPSNGGSNNGGSNGGGFNFGGGNLPG